MTERAPERVAPPVDEEGCPKCGCERTWIECRDCGGDGILGHDCGEDTCVCADPEDNVLCDTCKGCGGWGRCLHCHPMSEGEARDFYN